MALYSDGKKHDNCLFVAQQKITQISLNAGDTDILFIFLSVELGCSSSGPKELLCMCVLAKSKPEGKNCQSSRIQHSFIAEKHL